MCMLTITIGKSLTDFEGQHQHLHLLNGHLNPDSKASIPGNAKSGFLTPDRVPVEFCHFRVSLNFVTSKKIF